jgi:hypothetical protein
MRRHRQYPPYGQVLTARLRWPEIGHGYWGTSPDGRHVSLWVLCGSSVWETARVWIDTTLLAVAPPYENSSLYDWQVLAGHPSVLAWLCGEVSQEELDCLTAALIRDGVERILVMLPDKPVHYLSAKEEAA